MKKTKGQLFKEAHGYSKTIKRLLQKYKVTLEEYRKLRKNWKAKIVEAQKAKHQRALAGRKGKATKK